jgi:hypothetical protein
LKEASGALGCIVICTQSCTPCKLFGWPTSQLMEVLLKVTLALEHHLNTRLQPFWLADVQYVLPDNPSKSNKRGWLNLFIFLDIFYFDLVYALKAPATQLFSAAVSMATEVMPMEQQCMLASVAPT